MSNNPVMNRNPYFSGNATTPTMPQQAPYGQQYGAPNSQQFAPPPPQGYYPDQQAQQYAPAQGAFEPQARSGGMTYDDAMVKTLILLAVAVLSGAGTMAFLPLEMVMPVAIGASLAAFVLGMVAAFQRMVKPIFAIGYALLEGIALGALTGALNFFYPGVAIQAVLGTAVVVGVAVALHMSGTVRTTPRGRKIVMVVLISYMIFGILNMVLVWTGVMSGFGMRSGSFGILLGLVIIAVAGYMLIGDLETVKLAVANGAPKEFAWTCAFGIVMTILWIYVEVLRIAAILASDR
ncbi:MAG: Bax inhibitor-1/YccA family protein [Ancrocorticia sp.]